MSTNLITTEVLNAAIYTMRFYSDKMDKRSLTEPEFLAWQKVCRFVEAVFDVASQNVNADGAPKSLPHDKVDEIAQANPDLFPEIAEKVAEAAAPKMTLLMQFAQYCMFEDIDNIPAIARKSLFKGEFVPVHLLYGTLQDRLYRNFTPEELVVEFDRSTQEARFTWKGETVEVKREKQTQKPAEGN